MSNFYRDGLSDEALDEIKSRLCLGFNPEQIFLFGSRVWGEASKDSDADIFVVVSESALSPLGRSIAAHRLLRGLGVAKDVIVQTRAEFERYCRIKGTLEYAVAERGELLYERISS